MKNREVKFKWWDTTEKKFLEGIEYSMDSDGRVRNTFFGGYYIDVFPIQFTGLKDSKGIEIYEGDIVRTIYPGYPRCEVVFDSSTCAFRLEGGTKSIPIRMFRMNGDMVSEGLIDVVEEVIGNIFENEESE